MGKRARAGALFFFTACGAADGPVDNGAVTGAQDVDLPEPADCETLDVNDRLRWTGGTAAGPASGLRSVAVHGPRGFTCADDGGLTTWDLSGEVPVPVDGPSVPCRAVAVDATWLAVATDADVALYPLEAGGVVEPAATWASPGPVESMTLLGEHLWVAAGTGGWSQLDVAGELTELRSFADASSDARAVAVTDGFVHVASARAGVRTFALGDDDGGASLAATTPVDPALDVKVADGVLAVASLEGVTWLDVSEPAAPTLMGQGVTPGSAMAVELVSGHAVVADFEDIAIVSRELQSHVLGVEPLVGDDLLDRTRAMALDPVSGRLFVAQWDSLHAFDTACDGAAPALWPARRTLDFRVVSPGQSRSLALTLRNEGDAPLSITEVRAAMTGASVDFSPRDIEPAGAVALEVTFASPDSEPYEGALEIVSNDPDQPVFVVPMSGNVRGVAVGEPMVPFRNVDILGRVWQTGDAADRVLLLAYFADW